MTITCSRAISQEVSQSSITKKKISVFLVPIFLTGSHFPKAVGSQVHISLNYGTNLVWYKYKQDQWSFWCSLLNQYLQTMESKASLSMSKSGLCMLMPWCCQTLEQSLSPNKNWYFVSNDESLTHHSWLEPISTQCVLGKPTACLTSHSESNCLGLLPEYTLFLWRYCMCIRRTQCCHN